MPPDFDAFEDQALGRLQLPIADYYDAVDGEKVSDARRRSAATQVRIKFLAELRRLHSEAATMAADGALSRDERDLLADIIAQDTDYANGFIDALPDLSRAASLARCNAYLATIRSTYNEFLAIDLPVLPIYPQDDRLFCKHFCTCVLNIVRVGAKDWDVTWVIDVESDACDDCIRLSQEWQPLQIRNGEIMAVKAICDHDHIRRIKALIAIALQEAA